jgi:hypothetical protein
VSKGWYVEKWQMDRHSAVAHSTLDDFSDVRGWIEDTKKAGMIARIRAPNDATPTELSELRELGAERL